MMTAKEISRRVVTIAANTASYRQTLRLSRQALMTGNHYFVGLQYQQQQQQQFALHTPARYSRAFSTAVAQSSHSRTVSPRRKSLATTDKDPIVLTERAANRIKELLAGENAKGALGIRLGVRRRGCNGLSYTLNYAMEENKKDVAMEAHGVKIFIEPMALFNVVGTTMDWEETELTSEFTFNNPNSKGECGCGESFTV